MAPSLITLKRRADFLAAASSGLKYVRPCLIVQARKRGSAEEGAPESIRFGFTATKKLGNAVIRNRSKRRLRAAIAKLAAEHTVVGCDYVFIARDKAYRGTFDDLIDDMKHALKRLADQLHTPDS